MRIYITAICFMVVCVFCFAICSLAGEYGYGKFFGDDEKVPAGWSKGEKTGWDEQMLPPGLYAKTPADTSAEEGTQPIEQEVDGSGASISKIHDGAPVPEVYAGETIEEIVGVGEVSCLLFGFDFSYDKKENAWYKIDGEGTRTKTDKQDIVSILTKAINDWGDIGGESKFAIDLGSLIHVYQTGKFDGIESLKTCFVQMEGDAKAMQRIEDFLKRLLRKRASENKAKIPSIAP